MSRETLEKAYEIRGIHIQYCEIPNALRIFEHSTHSCIRSFVRSSRSSSNAPEALIMSLCRQKFPHCARSFRRPPNRRRPGLNSNHPPLH